MKALKGLMIYIGIVLAIILGIGVFLFCLMYFIPSMRIFGAGVVHANAAGEKQVIELEDYSNYDKIELNLSSKKINVVLKADQKLDDIKYALDLNCFGLAFDITEYRIIKDVSLENKVLSIDLNVTEPNGWISCYGSEMIVYVPANLTYDVLVKTESASVTLGDDKNVLQMNSLVANTTTGSLYVNKVSATDTLKLKALSLTTNSGNMDLSNIKNVNVSSKVVIYAKSGEFSFHNLNADIDVRGTGVRLVANSIKSTSAGLTFMSKDGYFKVKDLISVGSAESTIVTENCNITIDKVVGNAGIVTTYGNININKAENDLILESTHGDIKVKEARGDLRATSSFGNSAYPSVKIIIATGKFSFIWEKT